LANQQIAMTAVEILFGIWSLCKRGLPASDF